MWQFPASESGDNVFCVVVFYIAKNWKKIVNQSHLVLVEAVTNNNNNPKKKMKKISGIIIKGKIGSSY